MSEQARDEPGIAQRAGSESRKGEAPELADVTVRDEVTGVIDRHQDHEQAPKFVESVKAAAQATETLCPRDA